MGSVSAHETSSSSSSSPEWKVYNPKGKYRVLVTKPLVGDLWLKLLERYNCRVELCTHREILSNDVLKQAIGDHCDAVIGQLTEKWNDDLFSALEKAGGKAYANVAVGYDNVDVEAATKHKIVVGNTPGVLTETTAEMAVALIYAAARRVVEADKFMRAGLYKTWLPDLFLGQLLYGKTIGIVGAGRIGSTVGLTLVRGNRMNFVYYDKFQNKILENKLEKFNAYLKDTGDQPIKWRRAEDVDDLLKECDVVSLHPNLDKTTFHMINRKRMRMMKDDAIVVNCARGPVIDEVALVEHCKETPRFYAALDVFEDEPKMKPGLGELDNVIVVPHIASATQWTRRGMSALAAANVGAVLNKLPPHDSPDVLAFVGEKVDSVPREAPALLNAKELNYPSGRKSRM